MTARIVLSSIALFVLVACDATYGGIGTSPSEPAAALEMATPIVEAPPSCGVWVRATPDLADAASLAGEPPDVIAFPTGHATCGDAVTIAAERYPGRSFVRRVRLAWRAYEAD